MAGIVYRRLFHLVVPPAMSLPRIQCRVCRHPRISDIEAALRAGFPPLRDLSAQFGPAPASLLRHRDRHMPGGCDWSERVLSPISVAAIVAAAPPLRRQLQSWTFEDQQPLPGDCCSCCRRSDWWQEVYKKSGGCRYCTVPPRYLQLRFFNTDYRLLPAVAVPPDG